MAKPAALNQGRDISFIAGGTEPALPSAGLAQSYIERPLLLDGYKSDLRLYLLVREEALTSGRRRLRSYLYRQGLVRLSSMEYAPPVCSLAADDPAMASLLTNFSLHKNAADFALPDERGETGSKRSLSALWAELQLRGVDTAAVWEEICEIARESCASVYRQWRANAVAARIRLRKPANFFQLVGLDVLLSERDVSEHQGGGRRLRAHYLEVNHNPSLSLTSALDTAVKTGIVRDSVALVTAGGPLGHFQALD